MLDEIQSGMARTGRFLASQHNGIKADVVTMAKALGNGVPIGACLTSGKATGLLTTGSHGSTFGGNPLASAAALKTIEIIERDNLAERAKQLGEYIAQSFKQTLSDCSSVIDIRHKGLMIGIELNSPCLELVMQSLEKKLLINVAANNIVRLLPPLTMSDEEADMMVSIISELIIAR